MDSSELECDASGRLKSTPTARASLQNTGPTSGDGMTCEPSRRLASGASMLSAEDSPAKTSVGQVRAQASTEPEADCFTNSCASFARWDHESLCWKTWQRSLIEEWATFSDRWPRAGWMQSGSAFQRHPLALTTTETGLSCAPTARAQYHGCSQNRVNDGEDNGNLEDWLAVRLHRNGRVRGLKVNLTWLRWWMGFPIGWAGTDLDVDLETQFIPQLPNGSDAESSSQ